ncbi:MAG: ChrR family anti-sigma-E factor [Alphaproteobacteria bacterium]|nr:ChrR family anti-sigma-E factor [Alphaproteobacteria bacterium]MBU0798285.1 ChrR family anti-sigma-E factor [Alphaproteobacteria bacterium]MBU0889137.1 ChrR family anti-sigma-E factor [Alphaproteobacteria bacterium]MBU1812171.1 ChrR family anti-sigma-E factor [Alphaproteobacteria bacterium]
MAHHPSDEYLMDYAAGSASHSVDLLVATHLALCPECRDKVAAYEHLGGALLDSASPSAIAPDALSAMMARLDEPMPSEQTPASDSPRFDARTLHMIPEPLRSHLAGNLDDLKWSSLTRGIDQIELKVGLKGEKTRFYRIRGGQSVPQHTHAGNELTLVLAGSFSDSTGRYARGDVAIADGDLDHQPVADLGEDCYCLAVTDAPLRLTGPVGRFLNLFMRY